MILQGNAHPGLAVNIFPKGIRKHGIDTSATNSAYLSRVRHYALNINTECSIGLILAFNCSFCALIQADTLYQSWQYQLCLPQQGAPLRDLGTDMPCAPRR